MYFSRYPHSWAIHEPPARDGPGTHPHIHIQFSTRREEGEETRCLEDWFRQAPRGVAKDASWFTRGRLHDVRSGTAQLINAALEREGLGVAVTHEALDTLGPEWRTPSRYWGDTHTAEKALVLAGRVELRDSWHFLENDCARMGWADQKRREGIHDVSREAMMDHVRDHVWRFDRSPARQQEREASCDRAVEREWTRPGPVLAPGRAAERAVEAMERGREKAPKVTRTLARGAHSRDEVEQGVHWRAQEQGLER